MLSFLLVFKNLYLLHFIFYNRNQEEILFQIFPPHVEGPSMTRPPLPPTSPAPSNIQSRLWTEDPVNLEDRKIEKQRSVTFGSIDLLEPIEEDYSLESRV